MSEKEMRELEDWIEQHTFGRKTKNHRAPEYTTDPAAAMEVLKKCAELDCDIYMGGFVIEIWRVVNSLDRDDHWTVARNKIRGQTMEDDMITEAETLELAICLFAKKLFTKPTA